jgi:hypothetical protein
MDLDHDSGASSGAPGRPALRRGDDPDGLTSDALEDQDPDNLHDRPEDREEHRGPESTPPTESRDQR